LACIRVDVYVESRRLHSMEKARKSTDALSCIASMSFDEVIRLLGYIKALLAIPSPLVRYSIISAERKCTSVPRNQRCLVEQHNSPFSKIITTKPICRSSLQHGTAHNARGTLQSFPPTRAKSVPKCLSSPRVRHRQCQSSLHHTALPLLTHTSPQQHQPTPR
jgi:hypothetical protein